MTVNGRVDNDSAVTRGTAKSGAFSSPPRGRLGYARGDVDAFLQRLARGVVGIREIETVRFVNRRWRAYDVVGVDAFLDAQIERLRMSRPAPRRRLRDRGDGPNG